MSNPQAIEFLQAGLVDADGAVLEGGKVFTYQPGTTILKTTYQDQNAVDAHTNPIVLNSLGAVQAFGSGLYDIVVKSADESEILYTYEGLYYGVPDGTTFYGGESSGATNYYSTTNGLSTAPLADGQIILFKAHQTNTEAVDFEYNDSNSGNLINNNTGKSLFGGEIQQDGMYLVSYTFLGGFRLLNPTTQKDGWQLVPDAATYISATSLSLPDDYTDEISSGMPVRIVDAGVVKYGYVLTAVYSASVTTVTLVANSDYSLSGGAISRVDIGLRNCPIGFPQWFNYTPTSITGFSANPTAIYRFSIAGKTVKVVSAYSATGTSSTTAYTVAAPIAAKTITNMKWIGAVPAFQNNSADSTTPGLILITSGSSTLSLSTSMAGAAWTAGSTNKAANFNIEYEMT